MCIRTFSTYSCWVLRWPILTKQKKKGGWRIDDRQKAHYWRFNLKKLKFPNKVKITVAFQIYEINAVAVDETKLQDQKQPSVYCNAASIFYSSAIWLSSSVERHLTFVIPMLQRKLLGKKMCPLLYLSISKNSALALVGIHVSVCISFLIWIVVGQAK